MQCNFYFIQRLFMMNCTGCHFYPYLKHKSFFRTESLQRSVSGVTTAVLRIAIQRKSCIKVGTANNIRQQGQLILF